MNSFGYSIQKELKTFLDYVRNDIYKKCVRLVRNHMFIFLNDKHIES